MGLVPGERERKDRERERKREGEQGEEGEREVDNRPLLATITSGHKGGKRKRKESGRNTIHRGKKEKKERKKNVEAGISERWL